MTIKVGDKIPSVTLHTMGPDGPKTVTTDELFKGKKVAFFGLPGAFTPTCSAKHVPGFLENADKFKAKGVNDIVCLAMNDAFVMGAWGKDQKVGDKIKMVADGDGNFTKAAGIQLDLTGKGLGQRCRRFSMYVDDGVVKQLNLEEGGGYEVSSADKLLAQI
jgi:peroxiredoxin